MNGIDPVFTVGRLAADRERVIRMLAAEGVLRGQRGQRAPARATAGRAGHERRERRLSRLRRGAGGERLRVPGRPRRRPGPGRRRVAPYRLRGCAGSAQLDLDVVVVVRGGGARSDLAPFDSEIVARAITEMPVPGAHRDRPRGRPHGRRRGRAHLLQDADRRRRRSSSARVDEFCARLVTALASGLGPGPVRLHDGGPRARPASRRRIATGVPAAPAEQASRQRVDDRAVVAPRELGRRRDAATTARARRRRPPARASTTSSGGRVRGPTWSAPPTRGSSSPASRLRGPRPATRRWSAATRSPATATGTCSRARRVARRSHLGFTRDRVRRRDRHQQGRAGGGAGHPSENEPADGSEQEEHP